MRSLQKGTEELSAITLIVTSSHGRGGDEEHRKHSFAGEVQLCAAQAGVHPRRRGRDGGVSALQGRPRGECELAGVGAPALRSSVRLFRTARSKPEEREAFFREKYNKRRIRDIEGSTRGKVSRYGEFEFDAVSLN